MSVQPGSAIFQAIAKIPISRRAVISVESQPVGAFSKQSRLFRYAVSYVDSRHHKRLVVLRSNLWPAQAYRILLALWRSDRALVPRPLIYRNHDKMIVYQELAGRIMRELPLTPRSLGPMMSPLGRLLADVHRANVADLPLPSLARETKALKVKMSAVSRVERFRDVVRFWGNYIIEWWSNNWRPNDFTLTHGDFQPSNIIVSTSGRLGLIDFTLGRRFWPAADLASLIIHLRAMCYGHMSERATEQLGHRLINSYRCSVRPSAWRRIESSLEVLLAAAAIDVAATSILVYGIKDRHVIRLLSYLFRSIKINTAYE